MQKKKPTKPIQTLNPKPQAHDPHRYPRDALPCTGGVWVKKSARVSELKYQRGLPTHFIGTYQRGLLTQCQSSILRARTFQASWGLRREFPMGSRDPNGLAINRVSLLWKVTFADIACNLHSIKRFLTVKHTHIPKKKDSSHQIKFFQMFPCDLSTDLLTRGMAKSSLESSSPRWLTLSLARCVIFIFSLFF
jgi:hypothetical protein